MPRQLWALVFGGATLIAVSSSSSSPQTAQPEPREILTVSGRPLNDALRELEVRHGWVITYEDSFVEHADDLWDVTSLRRDGKAEPKVLVPRNKPLQFTYMDDDAERPDALLSSLLRYYNTNGNSEVFRLISQPPFYHVVPVSSRDVNGRSVARQSRLDVRITMPSGEPRTMNSFIDEWLLEVNRVSGAEIGIGLRPWNFLHGATTREGAQNEVALEVLSRAIISTGQKISWQLLCQPSPKTCLISFHVVRPAGTAP